MSTHHILQYLLRLPLPAPRVEDVDGVGGARADAVEGLEVAHEADGVAFEGDQAGQGRVHALLRHS